MKRKGDGLLRCASWLWFRAREDGSELRLAGGQFCQEPRLCQACAIRRAARMLGRYVERVERVTRQVADVIPVHVVTTVRDGADLRERFEHHRQAFRRLLQRRRDKAKGGRFRAETTAAAALGGVGSYEFKRGSGSGQWHPHHHAVWLVRRDRVPSVDQLSQEWRELTGDSFICHVEPCHAVQLGQELNRASLARDFAEVFKYALKFSDMTPADTVHAWGELLGARLVQSFGWLYGCEPEEGPVTDPLLASDLEGVWCDWFFRAVPGGYVREEERP